MSLKLILALIASVAAIVAALQADIDNRQTQPDGYPAPQETETVEPTWIDGCGHWRTDPIPEPWPTPVPLGGCDYYGYP